MKIKAETESGAAAPRTKTENITGAEALVKTLIAEGVETIFGYPGGAIMPVYDALHGYQNEIEHILTRHEQGATHAAQGYARVSNRVGVCLATSGPGATNLITGIADAQIDSTPIVCITGQVPKLLLGTDAFQETDVVGISIPVTKWNYQITCAEEIPEILSKAFYIARSGRPGPVLIDITKDAQMSSFDYAYKPCTHVRSYHPEPKVDMEQIREAARIINEAERPYVFFGQGIILGEAEEEFRTFLDKSGIPAAWTIMGVSALPEDHPQNVGMLGMHGNYGPNVMTDRCDVVIALGMRFDDRVTGDVKRFVNQARVIHVEIDAAELNKNIPADVAIHANVKQALPHLTAMVQPRRFDSWLAEFRKCDDMEMEKVAQKELYPQQETLTMAEVVRLVSEKTSGEAVVVSDVGQHQMIACRYYRFQKTRSNITSGGLGTMGFALPAAIGAKIADPKREVVAVIGDGGFQMTLQELGVLMQHGTAVKVIVLNNNFLGMVRQWQQLFFDRRYSHTEMDNPNFVKIAEAYNIPARQVCKRENLQKAVSQMIDHDGPYFLEVLVGKEDNVFPMVPAGAAASEIRLD